MKVILRNFVESYTLSKEFFFNKHISVRKSFVKKDIQAWGTSPCWITICWTFQQFCSKDLLERGHLYKGQTNFTVTELKLNLPSMPTFHCAYVAGPIAGQLKKRKLQIVFKPSSNLVHDI